MAMAKTSCEKRLSTNCQSHSHCTIYIMPNGDVRRSHSANFFKTTGRTEEEINQRPKRLQEKKIHHETISLKHPQLLLW